MKIIKPKHLFYTYPCINRNSQGTAAKKYLIEYMLAMRHNYAANLSSKSKLRTKTLIGHKNSHRRR